MDHRLLLGLISIWMNFWIAEFIKLSCESSTVTITLLRMSCWAVAFKVCNSDCNVDAASLLKKRIISFRILSEASWALLVLIFLETRLRWLSMLLSSWIKDLSSWTIWEMRLFSSSNNDCSNSLTSLFLC